MLRRFSEDVTELVRAETADWMVEFRAGPAPLGMQALVPAAGAEDAERRRRGGSRCRRDGPAEHAAAAAAGAAALTVRRSVAPGGLGDSGAGARPSRQLKMIIDPWARLRVAAACRPSQTCRSRAKGLASYGAGPAGSSSYVGRAAVRGRPAGSPGRCRSSGATNSSSRSRAWEEPNGPPPARSSSLDSGCGKSTGTYAPAWS